jgi:hypothetical protein
MIFELQQVCSRKAARLSEFFTVEPDARGLALKNLCISRCLFNQHETCLAGYALTRLITT